jgi:hypothetical protein
MRHIILLAIALMLSLGATANSYTVADSIKTTKKVLVKSEDGTYVNKPSEKKSRSSQPGVETGQKYKDSKGVSYPLLKNSKGRTYYVKTSAKSGKDYKVYVELEN